MKDMKLTAWLWHSARRLHWALAASCVLGCQTPPEGAPPSSLRRSGEVTFVCVGPNQQGAPLDRCPSGPRLTNGGLMVGREGYELHALVTQMATAEVAVVRLTGADDDGQSAGRVLDVDPTNPGVTPLRVGQQPVDIVTTPGGLASFVGVAEVGKEGIFALPTSCLFEPKQAEPRRDLTTWPACSLPSAPGDMVLLVDPADAEGKVRNRCGGSHEALTSKPPSEIRRCTADLSEELVSVGRRKLLVALPDQAKLVVIDAQELLDRSSGSFSPCAIEREFPLQATPPAQIVQPLPEDLVLEGCSDPFRTYGPFAGPFTSRPAGMSERDGLLAVADRGAPVVHLFDATDPCALLELDSLVATSFTEPERVVTTSRVAVSPLTAEGQRFVYAIDEVGETTANVMIFDVSDGQPSRTPLVRRGSAEMFLEPPDRIQFAAPAKDVTFALVDRPEVDPVTGTAAVGQRCDPDPNLSPSSPPARYRPNLEDGTGAGPGRWRGLFGFVLLGNGGVGVIDVDDFDAACRRPSELNSSSEADFRGCSNDPKAPAFYTTNGESGQPLTVTDEVSCRVVESHRARSGQLLITSDDNGTQAPSLRAFPRLTQSGRGLPVSRTLPAGRVNPMMLGVDLDGPRAGNAAPARVFVGNQLYLRGDPTTPLVIDPGVAEQPSVVLPWKEPRAYPSSEIVSVTYEGELDETKQTGLLRNGELVLSDSQAAFCDMGVQSVELTEQMGEERFNLKGDLAAQFAEQHADYVQIVTNLRPKEDDYWDGVGRTCGDAAGLTAQSSGFAACDALFGDGDADDLVAARDFRIRRAYQDHLEIEPRFAEGALADEVMEMLRCCFPGALSYKVRASKQWVVKGTVSGFRHPVIAIPLNVGGRTEAVCARDCSPLRSRESSRVFEISSTTCANSNPDRSDYCAVGPRDATDLVCAYDAERGPVEPGGVASECISDGITRRFAIYRGLSLSKRGMSFGFEVTGGFSPQTVALNDTNNNTVLPVSIAAIPTFNQLGVVDSQNRGLIMIDLRTGRVADSFY